MGRRGNQKDRRQGEKRLANKYRVAKPVLAWDPPPEWLAADGDESLADGSTAGAVELWQDAAT